MLLVLAWGTLYYYTNSIQYTSNGSHPDFLDSLYFSFVTFASIGYGDILPISKFGQFLVFMESVSSIMFVGIFGGYLTFQFFKRPDNLIITEHLHVSPYGDDEILFSIRIGNKGRALADCKLHLEIMQIVNEVKNVTYLFEYKASIMEFSWMPGMTNKNEDFYKHFKSFYNDPENSIIRTTMRGYDIKTGEVISIYRYYKVSDVAITGKFVPLYKWKGFERTEINWSNNDKTYDISEAEVERIQKMLTED